MVEDIHQVFQDELFEFFDSKIGQELTGLFVKAIENPEHQPAEEGFQTELTKISRQSELRKPVIEEVRNQYRLRKKYFAKLGRADFFATTRAAQQASSFQTAQFKAELLKDRVNDLPVIVLDLCSGIGIDSIGFGHFFPTISVDRDSQLVEFANKNFDTAQCKFPVSAFCSDVEFWARVLKKSNRVSEIFGDLPAKVQDWIKANQLEDHKFVWHLDPDRRDGDNRFTEVEQFSPGIEVIEELIRHCDHGLLKLAPATVLQDSWKSGADWFWIGHDRECKQLVGVFDRAEEKKNVGVAVWEKENSAWRIWKRKSINESFIAGEFPEVGDFLVEPDPCFFAGRLSPYMNESFDLLGFEGNYLCCSSVDVFENVFGETGLVPGVHFRAYRVLQVLPPKEKRVNQVLKSEKLTPVAVKKRNVSTDLFGKFATKVQTVVPSGNSACVLIFLSIEKKIRIAVCSNEI